MGKQLDAMRYGTSILKGIVTKHAITREQVWELLHDFLYRTQLNEPLYDVSTNLGGGRGGLGKVITAKFGDILDIIERDSGLPILGVQNHADKSKLPVQSFTFYEENGYFAFSSRGGESIREWDPLAKLFFDAAQLANAVAVDENYLTSQSKLIKIAKTNLAAAPAHTNRRDSYCEGVSAEMWLGEAFWQYASCTKEDVIKTDWLKVENRDSHLHIEAWHEPFTSADGEQGEVQRKLLKLLFDLD
ncbi:MAG: hypothetical protein HC904_16545 [Blastochloris sp.]|nr:hypothetical protein [Blastochloris sp.]